MDLTNNEQTVRNTTILIYSINLIGLAGNVLTFIIFSRRVFDKSPYRIYFKSLAIFDSFVVFNLAFGVASMLKQRDLFNQVNAVCKFVYFISVGKSSNSGWILVVFSVDQLIRVTMSTRFAFVKRRKFQLAAIAAMFLFHILFALNVMTQVEVKPISLNTNNATMKMCRYPPYSNLPIIYLIESSLIPFAIMVVTTSLILKVLVESRNSLKKYTANSNKPSNQDQDDDQQQRSLGPSTVVKKTASRKRSRDLRFAFNSVVFNLVFIVLTIPLVLVHFSRDDLVTDDFSTIIKSRFIRIKDICFVLFNLNFALHFWIHFCVNSIFRNEILVVLRIRDSSYPNSLATSNI